jgi:transcriptional regulator with XRE-family HTH domain
MADPRRIGMTERAPLTALGARIRALRHASQSSCRELAQAAGMSRGHLSRIELGQQIPSLIAIGKIAQALGRPPSDLLAGVPAEDLIALKGKYAA